MKHRIFLYSIAILFLCVSCRHEIEYKGEVTQPKLVLQAELGEGDTIVKAYVSRSRFFLDSDSYYTGTEHIMRNATIECKRGDLAWQKMTLDTASSTPFFVLPVSPALQGGETLRIRAAHEGYDTITAEQTVVHMPQCQIQFYNGQPNTLWVDKNQKYITLDVVLQNYPFDDAMLGISASIQFTYTYKSGNWTRSQKATTQMIMSVDSIFMSGNNQYETGAFSSSSELYFAPGYRTGYLVTLQIPYSVQQQSELVSIDSLKLNFNAHSNDSYWYRCSMREALNSSPGMSNLLGIEEGVQVYSNVKNGYGIIAACSRWTIQLDSLIIGNK